MASGESLPHLTHRNQSLSSFFNFLILLSWQSDVYRTYARSSIQSLKYKKVCIIIQGLGNKCLIHGLSNMDVLAGRNLLPNQQK